jgi:hypothetical protein
LPEALEDENTKLKRILADAMLAFASTFYPRQIPPLTPPTGHSQPPERNKVQGGRGNSSALFEHDRRLEGRSKSFPYCRPRA